jgi:ADP-heptose:LPS heptosyltransferase
MFNRLRKLDYLIGRILFLLFCKLGVRFTHDGGSVKSVKKILVIKLWGLGNLVIIYPLLYKIKERFPAAKLIFITFDLNKHFLEANSAIDEIIYFKYTRNIFKILRQLLILIKRSRKERIDILINFETFNNISALFSFLANAPLRIGLCNKYENIFYHHPVYNDFSQHISQTYLNLLGPLGIKFPYAYPVLIKEEDPESKISSFLKKHGIKDFVCVHPGTSMNFKGRRYSERYFSILVALIKNRYNLPVVFTGTAAERDLVQNIIKMVPDKNNIFNLSGMLSIWEFIELLKNSYLFISSDTGPVHIAASFGVNLVAFYGPTSPSRYGPLHKNGMVFYKNIPCSPCKGGDYVLKACRHKYRCLDFDPGIVFSKISERFKVISGESK